MSSTTRPVNVIGGNESDGLNIAQGERNPYKVAWLEFRYGIYVLQRGSAGHIKHGVTCYTLDRWVDSKWLLGDRHPLTGPIKLTTTEI